MFRIGAIGAKLLTEGSKEAWKFGIAAVVEIAPFVFGAVGFVGEFMEELNGVFIG